MPMGLCLLLLSFKMLQLKKESGKVCGCILREGLVLKKRFSRNSFFCVVKHPSLGLGCIELHLQPPVPCSSGLRDSTLMCAHFIGVSPADYGGTVLEQ